VMEQTGVVPVMGAPPAVVRQVSRPALQSK
jgi:hypothetical protein